VSILEEIFPEAAQFTFLSQFPSGQRGSKAGEVAAHHAVPTAAANASLLLRSLAVFGGSQDNIGDYYDHNNFNANGQYLSTNALEAHASGMALHASNHDHYTNRLVGQQLAIFQKYLEDKFEDEVTRRQTGDPTLTRASAIEALRADEVMLQRFMGEGAADVRGLQGYLRSGLV
jgi:hypothetical protein